MNYALGQGIEAEATNYVEKHGGKLVGSSKRPLGTSDFASLLLQAQNSKTKVIGLAKEAGRVEIPLRLLPAGFDHRCRSGVPPDRGRRLFADEVT